MSDTILAVAPNPAIDKTAVIPGYRLGAIHRPEQLIALAGGKGLNVARSIARLGGEVRACAMLAGHAGRWIAEQLNQESIPASITWTEGETRACLSVYDPETHLLTEVYENGSPIDPASWVRFEADVAEELDRTKLATFSGSLPPGAPTDGYARLLRLARDRGVPVVLDSRGEPLRHALPARPPLIKINLDEASEIMMRNICSIDDAIVAAQELRTAGAVLVILTLGKDGAIAVTAEGVWHATPPAIEAIAPVGSGDAFLGGLALAMLRGELLPQALCIGVAAGAANTLTLGPGMIEASQVWQLVDEVQLRRIPSSS